MQKWVHKFYDAYVKVFKKIKGVVWQTLDQVKVRVIWFNIMTLILAQYYAPQVIMLINTRHG